MASNKTLVPEAKEALNRFKMEAASEVGVNLKEGYNGDITSKQAGSILKRLRASFASGTRVLFDAILVLLVIRY